MDLDYPTIDEPATPEYVLAVMRDQYRHAMGARLFVRPEEAFNFDTDLFDWMECWNLIEYSDLGHELNSEWDIRKPYGEWNELFDSRNGTLGDLCRFIARRATRPTVRSSRLLCRVCLPAGAFLSLRSLLHKSGVAVDEIAPSTPLAPFARRHWKVIVKVASRLAPGSISAVDVRDPVRDAAGITTVAGVSILAASIPFMLLILTGDWAIPFFFWCLPVGWSVIVQGLLIEAYRALFLLPAEVKFGELRTFRDLAKAVAAGAKPAD